MAYKESDIKEASKATAKGPVKVRIIGGEEMPMAGYRDYNVRPWSCSVSG